MILFYYRDSLCRTPRGLSRGVSLVQFLKLIDDAFEWGS